MYGWEFPPHNSGGLGVACQGLTRALVGEGAHVTFVLPRRFGAMAARNVDFRFADVDDAGVTLVPIDSPVTPYMTSEEYEALSDEEKARYGNSLFDEVMRYAELGGKIALREQFDVIHAHDWLSFGAGLRAKELTGKPLVVHVHATEFDRTGGGGVNQRVYDLERKGMEKADAVVSVSQYTKNMVTRHYGISPDKVFVVHNGIDKEDIVEGNPSRLAILKKMGYKIVLFLGRITLQKGPDYFVRVAKRVIEKNDRVLFIVAGSGDMEHQIMRLSAEYGIAQNVLFTGFLRGGENADMYASADLYIMPSVSEPFGITPLESLSYGTPVIISKQSGVREVLPHALVVDFWDIDAMSDMVLAVLENPALAGQLVEEGKGDVRAVTWKKAAEKCVTVYKQFTHFVD
jgi:glycogen synthase